MFALPLVGAAKKVLSGFAKDKPVKKKKSNTPGIYHKPTFKQRIGLALTGADPISNLGRRLEEKATNKIKGAISTMADKLNVPKPIRKVASGVGKIAGTGVAAARLAGKVANPLFVPQMAAKKALGLGITLPGSKYIGPGNPMQLGKPTSAADAAAYEHDQAYDKYINSGIPAKKVYGSYSKADKILRDKADTTTPDGLAAYLGMTAKKIFQPKLNE